jgi:hypothetical protein
MCVCVHAHIHTYHTCIHTQRLPEVMDSSGQEAVWAPVGRKFSTVCTVCIFSIAFPGVLTFAMSGRPTENAEWGRWYPKCSYAARRSLSLPPLPAPPGPLARER